MNKISYKNSLLVTLISVSYLIYAYLLLGFKTDQLVLVTTFNFFYYLSTPTRKLIIGLAPFFIFWIIFDSMKLFPNYNFAPIHIKDLYLREKAWFGINDNGTIFTPNEYALKYSKPILGAMAGFFYLNWIPIPLLFGIYLFFFKGAKSVLHFSLCFLLVNLIGYCVYYTYPAAPPWYVQQYGFDVHFHTPTSAAGLIGFDDFFGVHLYSNMYAKSSNVFAAMPSLHSAYPVIVLYYGLKNKVGLINLYSFLMVIGIWFAAVYTSHHYVQDVLAGLACAATAIFLFEKVLLKTKWFGKFVSNYEKVIS